MKIIKKFEAHPGVGSGRLKIWNITKQELKDCFDTFIDDFYFTSVFGKKIGNFDVVDINPQSGDIELGFEPYIRVRLSPHVKMTPYELANYMRSRNFQELKLEASGRLLQYNLEIRKDYIEVLSIVFLIYIKKNNSNVEVQ